MWLWLTGGFDNEPTCGRPLGMRLTREGYLIVIDTYLGLFKVNVATGVICCLINQLMYLVQKLYYIHVCRWLCYQCFYQFDKKKKTFQVPVFYIWNNISHPTKRFSFHIIKPKCVSWRLKKTGILYMHVLITFLS